MREFTQRPSIAAILTSHNRRSLTLESIGRLIAQSERLPIALHVFVTDDGSTDGTAEALRTLPGFVHILRGSGSLYWAAGMALAEAESMPLQPDYLLWLNDDTLLDEDAIEQLLGLSNRHPNSILVGATRDPETGAITYGGLRRSSSWHPQRYDLLPVSPRTQECDTFHGNIVLIPRRVRSAVGAIDSHFPHAYADIDYGLRAKKIGIPVYQTPGTIGVCSSNPGTGPVRGPAAWRAAQGPKGLPWRAQVRFLKRHAGPTWPLLFVAQQVRMFLPSHP